MGVPVKTSIGRPKFPIPYELTEEVRRLMPWGLFGTNLSADEFTAGYVERLEKVGVVALLRQFDAIARRHGGARLVLLCFEDVLAGKNRARFCHRRVFADFWQAETGQDVPELSWMEGVEGVPVVVRCEPVDPEPPERKPHTVILHGAEPEVVLPAGYGRRSDH
jgi:hypothetical protein